MVLEVTRQSIFFGKRPNGYYHCRSRYRRVKALKRYEIHRAPRTSQIVQGSAKATTFYQFRSETTDEMRQYFKDGNFGSRDWLYTYDALGVDLAGSTS